jgi:hypothetical protein
VLRGHTVVYVGEELRLYVVRVSSLDHPLFRELLDWVRDKYIFTTVDTSVTPVFPKKTKCKPICMPGSSFMHIVTYK